MVFKTSGRPYLAPLVIAFLGMALRFEVQFLEPFFNNDEIDLGININQREFLELLYPLKHYQTAPPFFLWLFKCVYLFPFGSAWLKYKAVTFALNGVFLFVFWKFIRSISENIWVSLVALVMVSWNPFFIYHGLTLKQYLLDAIIAMLLIKSFTATTPRLWHKILWAVSPLLSNPALFIYTGKLLGDTWRLIRAKQREQLSEWVSLKESVTAQWKNTRNVWLWVPLLVYAGYFFWYKEQDGYLALTRFMWEFWKKTFLSNPHDFFIRIYYFFIGNVTFIFSHDKTLANLGTILLFFGLWRFFRTRTSPKLRYPAYIYLWSILVFVILNVLKMYPIAPRLMFYFSPFVVLGICLVWEWHKIWIRVIGVALFLVAIGNYALYFPFKENDVVSMAKRVEQSKPSLVCYSMNTDKAVRKFDAFTEQAFRVQDRLYHELPSYRGGDTLFVIKLVHQYGRNGKNGPIIQKFIPEAVDQGQLTLDRVEDGFNIYTVHGPKIIERLIRNGVIHPRYR